MEEWYCLLGEICSTEVSFVTSTYEVVKVARKCMSKRKASKESGCKEGNALGKFLIWIWMIDFAKFVNLVIYYSTWRKFCEDKVS